MKIIKFFLFLVVLAVGAAGAVAGLAIWYFGRDLPDYQQLAAYQPPIVTRIHAGDGRLMAEYATERRIFVPIGAMPPLVIRAFLAAEDRNFYSHPGIDPVSMLRAALADISRIGTTRRPEGASTITQQVAKNFLLSNEVSFERKIKEALTAIEMERVLSKDRILELYLNEIYLGGGSYGVAAAALRYFNKSLDQLDVEEAAFLAALPKAPNNYNPERNPEAAKTRRDWVIDRMVEAGFVSPAQGAAAKAHPLELARRDPTETVDAPFFTEEVRRELLERYGDKTLYEAGLSVRTSLDPRLEALAQRSLRGALIAYDRRHGYRGAATRIAATGEWAKALAAVPPPPGAAEAGWRLAVVLALPADGAEIGLADGARGRIPLDELKWARRVQADGGLGPVPASPAAALAPGDVVLVGLLAASAKGAPQFALEQIPEVSGGLVALDPHTGRVLAETGGFSYAMSQFDRATQAQRQTGSAIKPFVYLAALDHGFTPSTMVLDGPLVVDQGPGLPKWNPTNYEHKFYGPVPLRIGLEESLNLVTARVGMAVGVDTVGEYLKRFGIVNRVPPKEYSMLIGAEGTTLLKLATAYAMLDNGGRRINPTFIDRVQDREGHTIYRADDRPCDGCSDIVYSGQAPPDLPDIREQIADPRSTYQDVAMMEGVIQRGTGRSLAVLGRPLAGKTGTTNESNDTWFMGFSPDLVCGVYIGFDQPRSLGKRETGATVAAPAFKEFMGEALKDQPAIPFRIPPGLDMVRINATTGQLARGGDKSAIYEPFKPGTEPNGRDMGVVLNGGEAGPAAGTVPAAATAPEESDVTPATSAAPAPASGTGGLY